MAGQLFSYTVGVCQYHTCDSELLLVLWICAKLIDKDTTNKSHKKIEDPQPGFMIIMVIKCSLV